MNVMTSSVLRTVVSTHMVEVVLLPKRERERESLISVI